MKRFASILALILAVFSLTACGMVVDMGTVIEKGGSGSITAMFLLDEELYQALTGMSEEGDDTYDALAPIEYKGGTYYGQSISRSFANIDELKTILTSNLDSGELTDTSKPLFSSLEISETELKGTLTDDYLGLAADETAQYITLKTYVTFTFPYEIEETNGTIDANDASTVSWELSSFEAAELYAKTKQPGSPLFLYVIIIFFVLLLIVLIILIANNKKKKALAEEARRKAEQEELIRRTVELTQAQAAAQAQAAQMQTAAAEPAQAMEAPVQPEAPAVRKCPSCGIQVSPDAKFCPTCGTNLEENP